ncbi:MAG: hypothetical protein Kow0099_19110 [Candidatus Abyssubacteria bacterium]
MARVLRISAGTVLVFLGLLGFLLPILQGWLFLTLGLLLLSKDVPFLQRAWKRLKVRYPRIGRAAERVRKTFRRPARVQE